MRIGINGRFLVAKRTGVQRVAYNLLTTLVAVDKENHYILFTGERELENPVWQRPNVSLVPCPLREGNPMRNHWWEQFSLPRLASKHNVDILHSPANLAPIFYKGPSIIHIHDLCFAINPQWYSYTFHSVYNFVIPRLAKRATRIITNSNNSRNDLLQLCKVEAEKVSLVYWAVDDSFTQSSTESTYEESFIPPEEDYILYVGSLEPRKNISALVDAYQRLRSGHKNIKTKLVLIGGESPLFSEVKLKIKKFSEDVIFKGFVDDSQLRGYYQHATLVAYPSFYEGFGLPPLEAMASGAPVVTSKTSSLPEVVGNAALLISPYDPQQIADAMETIITDKDLRQLLKKRGFAQVKKFTWPKAARSIIAIYHELHAANFQQKISSGFFLPFKQWKKLSDN